MPGSGTERNLTMHPYCDPHDGSKGDRYTRISKPDFLAGAAGDVDKLGWSVADHANGIDQGGAQPGAPSFVGNVAEQRTQNAAYRARSKNLWKQARAHFGHNSKAVACVTNMWPTYTSSRVAIRRWRVALFSP